jgi:hypothetical protein
VTESQWLGCTDPDAMLDALRKQQENSGGGLFGWRRRARERSEGRKLRLFACACCRRIWPLLADERSRRAVETAERFAEGMASRTELYAAWAAAGQATVEAAALGEAFRWAAGAALTAASAEVWAAWGTAWAGAAACKRTPGTAAAERAAQCDLLRDIFGNPFAANPLNLAHKRRQAGRAVALARGIYEGQRFGEMPLLADVLRAVGCAGEDALAHCRSCKVHVRGCWVLDGVLGKN